MHIEAVLCVREAYLETPGERGRTFDGNLIQSLFVEMLLSTVNVWITIGNDEEWAWGAGREDISL